MTASAGCDGVGRQLRSSKNKKKRKEKTDGTIAIGDTHITYLIKFFVVAYFLTRYLTVYNIMTLV